MTNCKLAFNLGFNAGLRDRKSTRYFQDGDEESAFEYGFENGCKVRKTGEYKEYLYPLESYNLTGVSQ